MHLYPVTVSSGLIAIAEPSGRITSFEIPADEFEIHTLNDLLWERGWSVAGPWKASNATSKMKLTTVVLRRS